MKKRATARRTSYERKPTRTFEERKPAYGRRADLEAAVERLRERRGVGTEKLEDEKALEAEIARIAREANHATRKPLHDPRTCGCLRPKTRTIVIEG